jgi:serine/threonine-protein kinase RsbT
MTDGARSITSQIAIPIASDLDIVAARRRGRFLAIELGFSGTGATLIATAISELARNIVLYATRGEIRLASANDGGRPGIVVVARDEGPGIKDVSRAIAGGHSTSGGLGLGLAGVRRLMDEFEIASQPGEGTTVTVTSWKR